MDILETNRLILSEQTEEDTAFMLDLLNTPSWLKYIGDRNVKNEQDARNYILNRIVPSYKQNGFGFYAVRLKADNMPIGICGLVKRPGLEQVDIGFAFLPGYEGRGYGFESASAVMQYARNVLKLGVILAITVRDNTASIKLLNKIGLSFKEMVRLPGDEEELMLFESVA